ncbi:uncharacterized protein YndB with AHSA1/START domain/uncharacterized protein YciI [Allocatelliglobosispora scoriae]|uniref:Uncharacterized protein YndB with AHSA1/START domain/uncharacterized protein YciI n=1 Tax=Allocatelliglobosispora scoriae TaxID=643052 RepID=A0A841BPA3_9ACTN|nr:SRPBCC domain-containing protein [Allocatelliglobosispora scoriae]MBB5869136.1 uncharacterized protein YndB with AHSA1/START domain/uncharacterized protein YciI [Allocatelliglobosispora scoriae]
MKPLPPVRRQVVVPSGPELAFAVFTEEIGAWWPLGENHSVFGAGGTVAFRDGAVVETGPDGDESVWGSVLEWAPPQRLLITWHPGRGPDDATEVEVTFAAVGEHQTLVTLEHRGWERLADPMARRSGYEQGWPLVFGAYAELAAKPGPADVDGEVWFALLHTPGPAVWPSAEVFAHPDFAGHPAFLLRLREHGVLVAAGPLDGVGEGMAVIRVPAAAAAEFTALVQSADTAVTAGVLQVRVRPWAVRLTG